ncbi:ComEC/Rec2 family competence protein [Polaribacter sp. KT 15]|uniref:ComEC/Rec2 family competence protein n=1 Tax=Polaribacter sp. KT 15 TaxID=1896175 RepID=UPI00090C4710|nr:ComEC/Rec2 family competence protein [Polaribacter sp. KT 15]SHM81147.1 competence protein ComEC [Polaribacter sp. KT 15]
MKRLIKYVPLHFLVFLILGICLQFYYEIWQYGFLKLSVVFSVFLVLNILNIKKQLTTITSFLIYFLIGVSVTFLNDSRNYKNHYSNFYKEEAQVLLKITKVLKPGNYYQKYIAEIIGLNQHKTRGLVLLNVQKDTIDFRISIDDQLYVKPIFKELIPPLNPYQFNYKSYLAKQGIYHQIFIEKEQYQKSNLVETSVARFAEKIRNNIITSLEKRSFSNDELAVIKALLLGQRQDISKGLLTDYQNAGAIHILAVSGLHVGILLLILTFILRPIDRFKNGKYIKAIGIIVFLWMFAFIAGLSASVVRAVTMFSFVAIGQSFQKKTLIEFSLITSMLFLLLVKPMFLFDVGFQLSYLAVFGIIWVQPKLDSLYVPKYYLDKKIWQLLTVSIAAQVGILPISIYYFQQFPGLFMLSNIVIIPFLGIILVAGIVIIILSILNILPQFLADFYGIIISLMNSFVRFISRQEQFLWQEIAISFKTMLVLYFIIFSAVFFLLKKNSKRLVIFLVSIVLCQGIYFLEHKKVKEQNAFMVFHKSRFSVVGNKIGKQLNIQHNIDSVSVDDIKAVKPFMLLAKIEKINKGDFKNYVNFKGKDILIIDSLGVYQLEKIINPIVILQDSPKINLERMLKMLKPSLVIADGSNYKKDVLFWEKVSLKLNVPFHYTGQKGAFILTD